MLRRKPVKRSPVRRKPRKARVTKSGRVILDAKGMQNLRLEAWNRCLGTCECWKLMDVCPTMPICYGDVNWENGHLHHIVFRSRGGSDVIDNVAFITPECHERAHGRCK